MWPMKLRGIFHSSTVFGHKKCEERESLEIYERCIATIVKVDEVHDSASVLFSKTASNPSKCRYSDRVDYSISRLLDRMLSS